MTPTSPASAPASFPAGAGWTKGLRAGLRAAWPRVWPVLAFGLGLRLLFVLVGAPLYYGGRQIDIYTNGDSYSYVLSFRNLLDYGRYTFDLTEPDAAVGRLPGYPLFYGLHYLVFGSERVLPALAFTQVLLDTASVLLIYVLTERLAPARSWAPLIAALLLAAYPFTIVWTPITGTETLGVFLVLLWWAALVLARPRARNWLLLGVLLAVIVYVREFLGACLGATLLYLLLRPEPESGLTRAARLRPVALVLAGFLALYGWWPLRNYLTLGRFIPLKPAAAGYANLREDTQAALAWVLTWTNDVTLGMDEILFAPQPAFPAHVISTPAERQLIDSLVVLSRSCASSFHVRAEMYAPTRTWPGSSADELRYLAAQRANTLRYRNCNEQVSWGFERLRASYLRRHPLRGRVEVPLQNVQKILFKSQLQPAGGQVSLAQRLVGLLFGWRSVLLGLGLAGAWRFRRQAALWPALLFAAMIFGYMAGIFRSMEMRYLLQADVLLLVPAALLLGHWLSRWLLRRPAPPAPAT